MTTAEPRPPKYIREILPDYSMVELYVRELDSLSGFPSFYTANIVRNDEPELLVPLATPWLRNDQRFSDTLVYFIGPVFQGNSGVWDMQWQLQREWPDDGRLEVAIDRFDIVEPVIDVYQQTFTWPQQDTSYRNYRQMKVTSRHGLSNDPEKELVIEWFPRPISWAIDNDIPLSGPV